MSTTLSLEDDQLSFLYCFLLLCLDSIIYGLLALAVTKVFFHERKMNLEHLTIMRSNV